MNDIIKNFSLNTKRGHSLELIKIELERQPKNEIFA